MDQDLLNLLSEFGAFMLNLLLWFIFWTIVFDLIGLVVRSYSTREEREELANTIEKLLHRVKQETHGEIIYWFDADSDQFLGQGKDEEEIKKQLKERFKGHAFIIDDKSALAGPELKKIPVQELKLLRDRRTIA